MGDAQPDIKERDTRFMEWAITHALQGAGHVAPNPMVGCVIVKDKTLIIGHGWHAGPGEAHAEIMALEEAGGEAHGATAYVTLEPCNHHGRTGPCTEALIEAGVGRVIYAMADPNPEAAGGAERLRAAGIETQCGVSEKLAQHLNRAWVHSLRKKRPYVIAKTGMSLDGRIATYNGESQWITSEESRKRAHLLRGASDAIIVGAQTIIDDDPALTARLEHETRYPLRVVLDSGARTPPGAKVYERSNKGTLLATTNTAPKRRLAAFQEMGVEPLVLPAGHDDKPDLDALLYILHRRGVVTAMIEGGGAVLGSFFDADLIDEVELYIAPKIIGGGKPAFGGKGIAQLAEANRFNFENVQIDGPDVLMRGLRREGA